MLLLVPLLAILLLRVASTRQVDRETEPEPTIAHATFGVEASLLAVVACIKATVLVVRTLKAVFVGAIEPRDSTVRASLLHTKIAKAFTMDRHGKKDHEQGFGTIHVDTL